MFFKHLISVAAFAATAGTGTGIIYSSAAMAQEDPITLNTGIQAIEATEANGTIRETFVEPNKVIPGDTLLFTTSFRNNTASSISNFTIVNPLPESMVLSAASAAENDVSVDGGDKFGALTGLTVADDAGTVRPAMPADVTHLRWVIENLPAGQDGSVQYRASVR